VAAQGGAGVDPGVPVPGSKLTVAKQFPAFVGETGAAALS